jgi:hypothetical protein
MYKEYQPIAEPLDLVWRYDLKILGDKWQDWIPYLILPLFWERHRLN